jgi:hypothetical protein
MSYIRIYSDGHGDSHFEDVDISLSKAEYAPPAPPLELSAPFAAEQVVFFSLAPGWFGDWHPAPRRQFYVNLSGRLGVEASDGEVRELAPGDVVLTDDLDGRGHTTRVIGSEPSTGVFVHLGPDEQQA